MKNLVKISTFSSFKFFFLLPVDFVGDPGDGPDAGNCSPASHHLCGHWPQEHGGQLLTGPLVHRTRPHLHPHQVSCFLFLNIKGWLQLALAYIQQWSGRILFVMYIYFWAHNVQLQGSRYVISWYNVDIRIHVWCTRIFFLWTNGHALHIPNIKYCWIKTCKVTLFCSICIVFSGWDIHIIIL